MGRLKDALLGSVVGAAATVPMTAEFLLARRAELIDEIPPHKALRSVTTNLREPRLSWLSGVTHLAVGAVAGAIYGATMPERARGPVSGTIFGIGVWLAGYEFAMPAATDIAPAHRDFTRRAATIFVAHLIYGASLGWSMKRIRGSRA